MSTIEFAACTIVSKNHLAYARVLAASFITRHPGVPFFVLLADTIDGRFDRDREPFTLLEIDCLDIPELQRLCFQYTAFELSCAAKPYLLRSLFQRHAFEKLVYLDADLLLLESLTTVVRLLDECSIVLSPHLLADIADDGRRPSAREIIDVGVFNGGFFAVRNDASGRSFLDWLAGRLRRDGLFDLTRGMYCDQRWLSLVPGLFDNVRVLRDPGTNVGYWRLARARLAARDGEFSIDGTPVASFHFSGLPLDDLAHVSR